MASFTYAYNPPVNAADFERLCMALFQRHWRCVDMQRNARSGHAQHGVDLYGHLDTTRQLQAVQCKLHEPHRRLTATAVRAEVEKAKSFDSQLRHYAIATTANCNPALQALAREITAEHSKDGTFSFEIVSWDTLNDWLNRYSEIAAELYPPPTFAAADVRAPQVLPSRLLALTPSPVDAAKRDLEAGNPASALRRLDELRDVAWDQLEDRDRYRLSALKGHALAAIGDFAEGGRYLLEAASYQPHDIEAQCGKAVGLVYAERSDEALACASAILAIAPESAVAAAALICATPPHVDPRETANGLLPSVREDRQVRLVMARRLRQRGDLESAENLLRESLEPGRWSELVQELGETLIERQLRKLRRDAGSGPDPLSPNSLSEGVAYLQEVLDQPGVAANPSRLSHIHLCMALALDAAGNAVDSHAHVIMAWRADRRNEGAIVLYSRVLRERGQVDQAIDVVRDALGASPTYRLATEAAEALLERARAGDAEAAQNCLRQALDNCRGTLGLADAVEAVVGMHLDRQEFEMALREIEKYASLAMPVDAALLRARVESRRGNTVAAQAECRAAAAALATHEVNSTTRQRLASLLAEHGLHSEAFETLRPVVHPNYVDSLTLLLLRCANRSGADKFVLDFCRQLRTNGIVNDDVLDNELELLRRYNDHDTAIAILSDYLATQTDEQRAARVRVQLSILGYKAGRPEIVERDASRLPSVKTVDPKTGLATVQVLRLAGLVSDAARFAYHLFRRFPDELLSYRAVLLGMGWAQLTVQLEVPDTVNKNCAFQLRHDDGSFHWYVIEPDSPSRGLQEIGTDHPIARACLGHAVGDELSWTLGNSLRRGQISALTHKYQYRANECWRTFAEAFPADACVWPQRVPLRADGEIDGDAFRSAMTAVVEANAAQLSELLEHYRRLPVSLHLLAKRLGSSPFAVQEMLAHDPDVVVKCGTPLVPFDVAIKKGRSTPRVVDISALATLWLIEGQDILGAVHGQVQVTQGTLDSLHETIEAAAARPRGGAIAQVGRDRGLYFVEVDAAKEEAYIELCRQFYTHVRRCCTIVPGTALASVDPEIRTQLVNYLGHPTAEAVAQAWSQKSLLWTDETVVGHLAFEWLDVPWVWTSPIVFGLASDGRINEETANVRAALLAGFRFTGSLVNDRVLLAAYKRSRWDPNNDIARHALAVVTSGTLAPATLAVVVGRFMAGLWRTTEVAMVAESVLVSVLDALNQTPNGRSAILIVDNNCDAIFGVHVLAAQRTQRVISAWRAANSWTHIPPLLQ